MAFENDGLSFNNHYLSMENKKQLWQFAANIDL